MVPERHNHCREWFLLDWHTPAHVDALGIIGRGHSIGSNMKLYYNSDYIDMRQDINSSYIDMLYFDIYSYCLCSIKDVDTNVIEV